jgi:Protein of unknown function (DUF3631)
VGQTVAPYRTRRDVPALHDLRDRLAGWIDSIADDLRGAGPDMPLEDRAADTWEPLIAVADAAGGDWPARARIAAVTLSEEASADDSETSRTVRLLADIRDVFSDFTVSFLTSHDLVMALHKIEDAPWTDLTPAGLATRLRDYRIKPRRNAAGTARGYRLEDMTDAFDRYLPTPVRTRQHEA